MVPLSKMLRVGAMENAGLQNAAPNSRTGRTRGPDEMPSGPAVFRALRFGPSVSSSVGPVLKTSCVCALGWRGGGLLYGKLQITVCDGEPTRPSGHWIALDECTFSIRLCVRVFEFLVSCARRQDKRM